jgi:hypothetical protein
VQKLDSTSHPKPLILSHMAKIDKPKPGSFWWIELSTTDQNAVGTVSPEHRRRGAVVAIFQSMPRK